MNPPQRWFEREFSFDLPRSLYPNVLERLRGSPARLEERVLSLPPATLTARFLDTWSIQENVGHLRDLEPLWIRRAEQLLAGQSELAVADLTNRGTDEANHNAAPLSDLLKEFRSLRLRFLSLLVGADASALERAARHPRLSTPMRLIDIAFFTAEHDDHHLARITELLRMSMSSRISSRKNGEMTSPAAVWKEQRKIESFEVDVRGRLKAHMLAAYLLNCAWDHAHHAGVGYEDLSSQSLMWVLSKIQMSFVSLPKWRDQIVIETWGKRIERFYALRDFAVSTAQGGKICSATSSWMILDRTSYRPQRLEQFMKNFPWNPERNEIETNLKKVAEAVNEKTYGEILVSFSDIDVNNHVNAMRYLQWMLDSYPFQALTERELKYVEMNFIAEAVLGDRVSVLKESRSHEDLCCLRRSSDRQELCRAKIQWSEPPA